MGAHPYWYYEEFQPDNADKPATRGLLGGVALVA